MVYPYNGGILIVAQTMKGQVIGGFRNISCKGKFLSRNYYYRDPQSFVFSLTENIVFHNRDPTHQAVTCN